MPTPADPLDVLRVELRRLYREARGGRWVAPRLASGAAPLVADTGVDRTRLATFEREADARLAAAARNALPALFRAIDDARAARSVPVLGNVLPGGAVAWRGPAPGPVAARA
jgi:hypothetical protein